MVNRSILAWLGAIVAGAGTASGEAPTTQLLPRPTADFAAAPAGSIASIHTPMPLVTNGPSICGSSGCTNCCSCCGPRFYVSAESLIWWIKDGPVVPLLTTTSGPPGAPNAGVLGNPDTTILLGGSDIDYNTFSGGRFTVGGWLDDYQSVGLEATGFFLGERDFSQTVASPTGTPPLYVPYVNAAGASVAQVIAGPGGIFGTLASNGVTLSSSSSLWGAEINSMYNLQRSQTSSWNFLAGFRHADLDENLTFFRNSFVLAAPANFGDLTDVFQTRSKFYGANFGLRGQWKSGNLTFDVTGKLALGANRNSINASGQNVGGGVFAGLSSPTTGFFTTANNIGERSATTFSVLPEINVNAGYQLTRNLRVNAGYNFLFWSNVVRPGNQIDPANNFFNPASRPPLFNRSDFWAHGLNLGIVLAF